MSQEHKGKYLYIIIRVHLCNFTKITHKGLGSARHNEPHVLLTIPYFTSQD